MQPCSQPWLDAVFARDSDIYATASDVECLVIQEGQHPLTGQRAANFRLLTNQ